MLFDDFQRTDKDPAEPSESLYAFLNCAAGERWQNVRDVLTGWLANYPESEQAILVSRFRRTDRRGFLGAFWELYLHELFLRLGFRIELHPTLNGTTHRPDFLLHRDGQPTYVEAVTIYEPQAYSFDDDRLTALRDVVDRISSSRFRVAVDARQIASTPLPLGRLSRELETWLTTLETQTVSCTPPNPSQSFRWQEDGWMLIFRPVPLGGEQEGTRRNHGAGVGKAGAKTFDDARSIRNRLGGKSRVYGRSFDAPFLIALTSYRSGHQTETVLRALFGLATGHPDMMRAGTIGRTRATSANGLWLTNSGTQYQDISAVLTAFDVMPWSISQLQPVLTENPWATHPLAIELPFDRYQVDVTTGAIQHRETRLNPRQVFGLGLNWPCAPNLADRDTSSETQSD